MPKPHPAVPALRSVDIVRWASQTHPESFTVADVSGHFGIVPAEANHRISYLIRYGMVRRVGRVEKSGPGRRRYLYTLTAWGRQYAARKPEEEGPCPT